MVRDATAVAYDLTLNSAIARHIHFIEDSTCSSPHFLASMTIANQNEFQSHGRSFHAPWIDCKERMLGRTRMLDIVEEGLNKRAPVLRNFKPYIEHIIKQEGCMNLTFTPNDEYGSPNFLEAFRIEDGVLIKRNDHVIEMIIDSLKTDLQLLELKENAELQQASAMYMVELRNIQKTTLATKPQPTTLVVHPAPHSEP